MWAGLFVRLSGIYFRCHGMYYSRPKCDRREQQIFTLVTAPPLLPPPPHTRAQLCLALLSLLLTVVMFRGYAYILHLYSDPATGQRLDK